MKKIISIIFIFIIGCLSAPIPEKYKQVNNSNIYETYDEFQKCSFYRHAEDFEYGKSISLYIFKRNNDKTLRLILDYTGISWIFFKQGILTNGKDNYIISFNPRDKKEILGSGFVSERVDIALTQQNIIKIEKLFKSDNIRLRLDGQYVHDYTLKEEDINMIRELIVFYKKL